jgi:hypothetical protein
MPLRRTRFREHRLQQVLLDDGPRLEAVARYDRSRSRGSRRSIHGRTSHHAHPLRCNQPFRLGVHALQTTHDTEKWGSSVFTHRNAIVSNRLKYEILLIIDEELSQGPVANLKHPAGYVRMAHRQLSQRHSSKTHSYGSDVSTIFPSLHTF